MKVWKTQDKTLYTKLNGMVVAVRTLSKLDKKCMWDNTEYERAYNIVKVVESKLPIFLGDDGNEYSIGDIIKVF